MATLFLHVPELEAGISEAEHSLGTINADEAELKRAQLMSTLKTMFEFAQTNLQEMLNMMGFNSIEELNSALRDYNNLHLSLSQLFPAFSEPQITEVLARSGIGMDTKDADYGLIISALEDAINRKYPEFAGEKFFSSDMRDELNKELNKPEIQNELASSIMAQLFGGITNINIVIDFANGRFNSNELPRLMSVINKNAKSRGSTGVYMPTLNSIYLLLRQFFQNITETDFNKYINQDIYEILEGVLKKSIPQGFQREILTERIRRGNITVSTKVKTSSSKSNTDLQITSYLDALQVKVDKNLFNLNARGNTSIENYVNKICDQYPEIKAQITENIKQFYWNIIQSYIPVKTSNPITYEDFSNIINEMVSKETGNIGWFFSQSSSKALGAGMFGEVAGMIYMNVLCPNLKTGFTWAGGVTDGAKPPADIILAQAGKQFGIQIKNYTSGTTLSHDYGITLKNIVDQAAQETSKEKTDLMSMQASQELEQFGITSEEIEAVQNIIIANTFNIPYKKQGNQFVAVSSVEGFSATRARIDAAYLQATRYMAIISLIMHRVQYYDNINRRVSATTSEKQLQNTLWLINGQMFVSSVQILEELMNYIEQEANNFFNVTTSIRISKDNAKNGLSEGRMTIVEYLNYDARGLGKTALTAISARIGTNYRMSAFNP